MDSAIVLPGRIRGLILNFGGGAEQLAAQRLSSKTQIKSFAFRMDSDANAIADFDPRLCRKLQQLQWQPSTMELLVARLLFPLSSVLVIFADQLGGLRPAASVVAGLCRFSSLVETSLSPSLLVLSSRAQCSTADFGRLISEELLEIHRTVHPDVPYTFPQIRTMWNKHLGNLKIIDKPASQSWRCVQEEATVVTETRQNGGYGCSEAHFRRFFQHMLQAFDSASGPLYHFSILDALGIPDIVTEVAKINVRRLMDSKYDIKQRVEIVASCLAFNAYRDDAYVSYAGLVVESFASRLLQHSDNLYHGIVAHIREYILRMVDKHHKQRISLLEQHLRFMKACTAIIPGCSLCMLHAAVHNYSCTHNLCSQCQAMVTTQLRDCPRCAAFHDELPTNPLAAGIRVLGISGPAKSALNFLSYLRNELNGHLRHYFDLVICSESCSRQVIDYFGHNIPLPQCSKNLKDKKNKFRSPEMPPLSQPCIVVLRNDTLVSNCLPRRQWKKDKGRNAFWWKKHAAPDEISKAMQTECHALWSRKPWLQLEHHGGRRGFDVVGKLFASLFYVQLLSLSDRKPTSFLCHIAVKCRLPAGHHLNSVVQTLMEKRIRLYCTTSTQIVTSVMCDAQSWESFTASPDSPFVRDVSLSVASLHDQIQVRMDNITIAGMTEDVGNSPTSFNGLMDKPEAAYIKTDFQAPPRRNSEENGTVWEKNYFDKLMLEIEEQITRMEIN